MYNTFSIVIILFLNSKGDYPMLMTKALPYFKIPLALQLYENIKLKSTFLPFKINILQFSSCSWCTWPESCCQPHG